MSLSGDAFSWNVDSPAFALPTPSPSPIIGSIPEDSFTNNYGHSGDADSYFQYQISPLSDSQVRAMSTLTVLSSMLSILGSSTILYRILKNRLRLTPYDRMMLGISVMDILASLGYAMNPFFLPFQTSQRVWAFGNDATCTALGWWTQLSFLSVTYNALLSFYYLFIIRYGMSRQRFASTYETGMHFMAWMYFLATASIGASMDWYSEFQIGLGCWVGEIPKGCQAAGTCQGTGQLVGWLFGGIPILGTYLSLIINNVVIYSFVRRTLRVKPSQIQSANNAGTDDEELEGMESGNDEAPTPISMDRRNSLMMRSLSWSSSLSISSNLTSAQDEERILRQQAQVREVATQGFLYVLCFFLSYTTAFIIRVFDGLGAGAAIEGRIYPLLLLNAMLLPLQGFLNLLVHTRPTYLRYRCAYPELGKWSAWSQACWKPQGLAPRWSDIRWSTSFHSEWATRQSLSSSQPPMMRVKTYRSRSSGFSSNLELIPEETTQQVEAETQDETFLQEEKNRGITSIRSIMRTKIDEIEEELEDSHDLGPIFETDTQIQNPEQDVTLPDDRQSGVFEEETNPPSPPTSLAVEVKEPLCEKVSQKRVGMDGGVKKLSSSSSDEDHEV